MNDKRIKIKIKILKSMFQKLLCYCVSNGGLLHMIHMLLMFLMFLRLLVLIVLLV